MLTVRIWLAALKNSTQIEVHIRCRCMRLRYAAPLHRSIPTTDGHAPYEVDAIPLDQIVAGCRLQELHPSPFFLLEHFVQRK